MPGATLSAALGAILTKRRDLTEQSIRFPRSPALPCLTDSISESPAMMAFMRTVQRVVDSGTSLLILSETGVGKERLGRAIHAQALSELPAPMAHRAFGTSPPPDRNRPSAPC